MSSSFATPWIAANQDPLSMGFPREYWSGLPFPSPGYLSYPGIEPGSPALQADSLQSEPQNSVNVSSYRQGFSSRRQTYTLQDTRRKNLRKRIISFPL